MVIQLKGLTKPRRAGILVENKLLDFSSVGAICDIFRPDGALKIIIHSIFYQHIASTRQKNKIRQNVSIKIIIICLS
jgi:hypothetical protein